MLDLDESNLPGRRDEHGRVTDGGVNTIPLDTEIHEQITVTNGYVINKWLRKSVYDDKHIFNNGETIVDNYVNDATHVDAHKMQI